MQHWHGLSEMAGLRKKQRIKLIAGGLVLLALATFLVGYGLREGIQYFRSPSQIAEAAPKADERFRLGGLVEDGTLVRTEGETVRFSVTDGAASVNVTYTGILPDLFREGQGMVATGTLQDGVFVATEVLAKHDEKYMPKEVADALKEQGLFKPTADGS